MWYWFIFRLNTCIGAPILTWPTIAYSMYDTREELVSDNNLIVMTFCRYGRKYIAINIAYDDIISWNALCVEFLDHSWFSSASKQWPQSLESNTDVGNLYIYFASASLSSLFIYMNIYIYWCSSRCRQQTVVLLSLFYFYFCFIVFGYLWPYYILLYWFLNLPVSRMFVKQFVQADIKGNTKSPHRALFMNGTPRSPVDSPHKGPEMRKALPCHDFVMKFWWDLHAPFSCISGLLHWHWINLNAIFLPQWSNPEGYG